MLRASAGFREGALLQGRVHCKTSSRPATLAQPSLLPLRFSLDGNFFFYTAKKTKSSQELHANLVGANQGREGSHGGSKQCSEGLLVTEPQL